MLAAVDQVGVTSLVGHQACDLERVYHFILEVFLLATGHDGFDLHFDHGTEDLHDLLVDGAETDVQLLRIVLSQASLSLVTLVFFVQDSGLRFELHGGNEVLAVVEDRPRHEALGVDWVVGILDLVEHRHLHQLVV